MKHKLSIAIIFLLLAGCGGQNLVPQPTAPATVAPTATAQAAATVGVSSTPLPQQANAAPQPTAAPQLTVPSLATSIAAPTALPAATATATSLHNGVAFYPCNQGLCRIRLDGSDARTVIALPDVRLLRGFGLSPNAAQLVYALEEEGLPGTAQLFTADLSGANQRGLFLVQGVEDGQGALSGFGVLGFNADASELIVEQKAQLWRVSINAPPNVLATNLISITEQLRYGASSTHTFTLSPNRQKILFIASGKPTSVTIYDIASGTSVTADLPNNFFAVGFGDDDNHLIAMRVNPPFDPKAIGNPATLERAIQGYVLTELDGTQPKRLFDVAKPNDQFPSLISNFVNRYAVFQNDGNAFFVLGLASGKQTPLKLPDYLPSSVVRLAFTRN